MRKTTLCYLERNHSYLMLHRIKKKNDPNHDKWIGIGGGFLPGETDDECLLREVHEETGFMLKVWKKRGVISFISDQWEDEEMHLYTATEWTGKQTPCDEGEPVWVDIDTVPNLPLWEGDRIFLRLLRENAPFFHLRLEYQGETLARAILNDEPVKGEPL